MSNEASTFHRARSHWLNNGAPYQPNAPLEGDHKADVCVIGAGITGLSTAYHLMLRSPGLRVVVLEQEVVGFGASGRNAGQLLVSFGGGDMGDHIRRHGAENVGEALSHVESGINLIHGLKIEEEIDCDFEATGYLKTSLRVEGDREVERHLKMFEQVGHGRYYSQLTQAQLESELHSPHLGAALYDPRGGQFNPLKLVRGLKVAAEGRGAQIHESSPVVAIRRHASHLSVETGLGSVNCEKLVLATNAFTHLLAGGRELSLHREQYPLISRATITAPLSDADWESAGWPRRSGVNVLSSLFFSFMPTRDGRILWVGGFYTHAPKGGALGPEAHASLRGSNFVGHFFPRMAHVPNVQTWGGPISITADWTPHVGFTSDPRIVYACGCWGHGMALSTANGRALADLTLNPDGEASRIWFIRRTKRRWPSRWLSDIVAQKVIRDRRRGNRKIASSMSPPMTFID